MYLHSICNILKLCVASVPDWWCYVIVNCWAYSVCVRACMCVHMYVCMCVCICMYVCVRVVLLVHDCLYVHILCSSSVLMEALLVPYGNIVEGVRRSLSHISSKDVTTKSTDKVQLYMGMIVQV